MAELVSEFRAKSDAFKAEINAAVRDLETLPAAQQKAALKMQAAAGKGAKDAVAIRQAQVAKELLELDKLAKETPELYARSEAAKKKILEAHVRERIRLEENAANAAGAAQRRSVGGLQGSVKGLREAISGTAQAANAMGNAFGSSMSKATGLVTGLAGSLATGGVLGAAIAGTTFLVGELVTKWREVHGASEAAKQAMRQRLADLRTEAAGLIQKYERAARLQQFLLGGGSEAAFAALEEQEAVRGKLAAGAQNFSVAQGELVKLIARRQALGRIEATSPSEAAALLGEQSDLDAQIRAQQEQVRQAAVLFGQLATAEQGARGVGQDQGPNQPTFDNGGLGRGGGSKRRRRERASPDQVGNELVFAIPEMEAQEKGRADVRAYARGLREEEERLAKEQAALAKQRTKELEQEKAKVAREFALKEAKDRAMALAGLQAGATFLQGFSQALSRGDGAGIAGSILRLGLSAVGLLGGPAGAGFAAIGGTLLGAAGLRGGGGAWALPQGRWGLPGGVNFDARLTHFDHPEEWKWSRQAVAGAGGPDAVARMHADAKAGRLGLGSRSAGQPIYVSAFAPHQAAEAVRDLVAPGMTTVLSNHDSQLLEVQMQESVRVPRYR